MQKGIRTEEEALAAVRQCAELLWLVPEALRTFAVCLEAVRHDGRMLQNVPDAVKTPELCAEAVRETGAALEWVPEPLKTPELCLAAVETWGWALRFVPEALKTPEICRAAVEEDGWALEWVPERLRTPDLCLDAVHGFSMALEYVPEALKTRRMCLDAVKAWGSALEHVPEELKDRALCLQAVLNSGASLEFVPDGLKDPELCLAAVKSSRKAGFVPVLAYVPEALKTPELCLAAARRESRSMLFVPEALRPSVRSWLDAGMESPPEETPAQADPLEAACAAFARQAACLGLPAGCRLRLHAERINGGRIAVRIDGSDTAGAVWPRAGVRLAYAVYWPKRDRTLEPAAAFAFFANMLDGKSKKPANGLPKGFWRCCAAAVRNAAGISRHSAAGKAVAKINEKRMKAKKRIATASDALAAVRRDGWNLKDVPESLKTPDVCLAAVRQEELAMPYVPDGMQDGLRRLLLGGRAGQNAGDGVCGPGPA